MVKNLDQIDGSPPIRRQKLTTRVIIFDTEVETETPEEGKKATAKDTGHEFALHYATMPDGSKIETMVVKSAAILTQKCMTILTIVRPNSLAPPYFTILGNQF